jgi:hypothetical protein
VVGRRLADGRVEPTSLLSPQLPDGHRRQARIATIVRSALEGPSSSYSRPVLPVTVEQRYLAPTARSPSGGIIMLCGRGKQNGVGINRVTRAPLSTCGRIQHVTGIVQVGKVLHRPREPRTSGVDIA